MYYGYGYGFGYGFFGPYALLLLAAVVFTMYASYKVNRNFQKYVKVSNRTGMTGMQAARRLLDLNGLNNVKIEPISGNLTDHYDHRNEVIRLSENVISGKSISAVSIAAHEVGHALQKKNGYAFFKFRDALATPVSFAGKAAWILIVLGLILTQSYRFTGSYLILDIGIVLFSLTTLFHLVTLPVELDASRRALNQLEEHGIIFHEEKSGARKVLGAAALTYVAALAVSVIQLLRILAYRGRNN